MENLALRARSLALGAIAWIAVVIAGALPAPAAGQTPELSGVTLRVADQAGQIRAKLELAEALQGVPYQIEWSVYPAALNIHEALKANAVDIGFAGDSPTVSAIAGGSKIKVVAGWETGGRGRYIVVPKDSDIRSIQDLRGKTISPTGRGSAGHYIVLAALKEAGLTTDDVTLAFLAPADASAAFASGSIDAWGTWGIHGARAQGALGARVLFDGSALPSSLYVVSATDRAIDDPAKRLAIADLVQRIDTAYGWARENKEAYIAWYAGFAKQDEATARRLYDDETSYRRAPVDDAFAATLQSTYATWVEAGVLEPGLELDGFAFRGLDAD